MKRVPPVVLAALLPLGWHRAARAHEGFITTYNHHIEKGELALMLFSDYTSPSEPKREEDGQGDYFSQMLELKYAPLSQLVLELMAEAFEDVETGEGKFTGFRYEARYRLFEKPVPLNPMVYVEYEDLDPETRYKMEVSGWVKPPYREDGREPSREKILETRVILSQDIERWNLAFNWINETDFVAGDTGFGYSMGALYRLHGPASEDQDPGGQHEGGQHEHQDAQREETAPASRSFLLPSALALESFGALGDTRSFGIEPSRQEHYLQPSILFHLGERAMLGLGFAIGLTGSSDDMVRLTLGWRF